MEFQLSPSLWGPQPRTIRAIIEALDRVDRVCVQSPTGSGKTRMSAELLRWCLSLGHMGSFYINRIMLIEQTSKSFTQQGLYHGIRAANYEHEFDDMAPVQICSSDTEGARVYKSKRWDRFPAWLMIIDEGHLQRTKTMEKIVEDHLSFGGKVVIFTATPIGMSDWADELIVSGTMAEYRACGALVPAKVFSITSPDMRKVKRNLSGEFIMDGKMKKIFTQHIVGSTISSWKKYNPDGRPTLMYAPGVAESVWLTEQFAKQGVKFIHVDANDCLIDGKRAKLTRPLRREIMEMFKDGKVHGLSSRFLLREGVDAPFVYCGLFATPVGSLASYLQMAGRLIRRSDETPDEVILIDQGGSFLRHGSPNDDRPWHDWWRMPAHAVSESFTNKIRDGKTPEPICCPSCHMERKGGVKCPHCGHEAKKGTRTVVMEDGKLKEYHGQCVKHRYVQQRHNTEELWAKMFWGFKKKGIKKSFAQMYGWFAHEHGYAPPRDLPFMPKREEHWYIYPSQASFNDLHSK